MINMSLVYIIAAFWGSLILFIALEHIVRVAFRKSALRVNR